MDKERGIDDLQSLLDAIKASDVVECRIQLISQLGNSALFEKSELVSLVKHLADSTCLDVSQCMLNKAILHIITNYLQKDISGCLEEFLSLGTKASIWCVQHFKTTLISTEESQEEHSSIFFQLVLDLLSFAAASFSALTRTPFLRHKVFMLIVEKFIFEQLNLTKISISEIKSIHSIATEVQKKIQEVLAAVVRLCRAYFQALTSESREVEIEDEVSGQCQKVDNANLVINITTCTINSLYKIGIVAASGGGSLVAILNASWKGVVSLLQLDRDLAANVNVADIVLSLILLATESLKCAAESCSSRLKENIVLNEAKKPFLPVKFYLIHAVRIISQYPCEAFTVYREITLCALMISAFGISLSKEPCLKASSEALTELLCSTSSLLVQALLSSVEVKEEQKLQILDCLFTEDHPSSICPKGTNKNPTSSMAELFTLNCETMPRARTLMLGRVLLFLNLLRNSPELGEDARHGLSRKLAWFFNCLVDEDVYSSVLVLQIPMLYSSGEVVELVWQPMFSSILSALKTLMIVASSSLSWEVVETSLLENLLHPHFLVWEIVMELWCFFIRHAETDMLLETIDKLCSLFKSMISSKPVPSASALRKMARSICMLLTYAPQCVIDQVYSSIITDGKSQSSSIMYVTFLMEGFPLTLLSDNLKNLAVQRIISAYCCFIESNHERLQVDSMSSSCSPCVLGEPVYALSCALRCLEISSSNIDYKTLKFTLALINGYRSASDSSKDTYCKLLSHVLAIISNMKHLYASTEMGEVILELRALFGMDSVALDIQLNQCKPDLSLFVAGVAHMEIGEGGPVISALWEMYHILLREKHWAFIHLAITAFGYFASRTSCNQLWRFVPHDAALSFDVDTGSKINEERFMSELKAFLEKQVALTAAALSIEEQALLAREGRTLKETLADFLSSQPEDPTTDIMEIDSENQVTKKRKLPDGINEGMSLLQNGLKVIGDGLAQWRKQHSDSTELQKFSTHFSCLEDAIAHMVSLSGINSTSLSSSAGK